MNGTSRIDIVSEYLNETVNYGGIRMPRHRMIAQLTETAKATGRADWRILVDRYLQGHELAKRHPLELCSDQQPSTGEMK